MGRILAIDFGTKRTGIAVTDELKIIASGLTTVSTADLLPFLTNYFNEESVEAIVIGAPKRLSNQPSDIEHNILDFIAIFKKKFPTTPVHRIDERFTSKIAFQSMLDSGLKKKKRQDKALIDEISATLILQSFMPHYEK